MQTRNYQQTSQFRISEAAADAIIGVYLILIRTKSVSSARLSVDNARAWVDGCLHVGCAPRMPFRYRVARWWRRLGLAIAGWRLRNMSPREYSSPGVITLA